MYELDFHLYLSKRFIGNKVYVFSRQFTAGNWKERVVGTGGCWQVYSKLLHYQKVRDQMIKIQNFWNASNAGLNRGPPTPVIPLRSIIKIKAGHLLIVLSPTSCMWLHRLITGFLPGIGLYLWQPLFPLGAFVSGLSVCSGTSPVSCHQGGWTSASCPDCSPVLTGATMTGLKGEAGMWPLSNCVNVDFLDWPSE